MFSFNRPVKFYIYNKPTDMRKSFDGLSGIIINHLERDPLSGSAYLFINRSRNRLKILLWDHGGYWILYKRLEQGTFQFADDILSHEVIELGYEQLQKLVCGVDIVSGKQRKRHTF
jgi:hypothetical protein